MQYEYATTFSPTKQSCLVIGVLSEGLLPNSIMNLASLEPFQHDLLTRLARQLEKPGDSLWQSEFNHHAILLIHCGNSKEWNEATLKKRLSDITQILIKQRIISVGLCLPLLADQSPDWQVHQTILQIAYDYYQLLDFKSKEKKPYVLETVSFIEPEASLTTIKNASALADSIRFTRDLANLPANVCTPNYLAETAESLAKHYKTIKVNIMEQKALEKMGMGSFLSVSKGSTTPPKFIELHYKGSTHQPKPVVLVGKGVTFDSGGISLKPASMMEEMKYDMAGAASVLGTLKACAMLALPIHVIGLIPATENMPDGGATKPGDIVTSLSGQTIEITNTDAEGRLILADALTYAERFHPEWVIDIATLTGAVIMALGYERSGLMTTDSKLAEIIISAAQDAGDKVWRLPLEDAYQHAIDSPLADIANASADRAAGTITGACFLSRFTTAYRWAHLDIAGTAWISGKNRQATGRPVSLLVELLKHVAATH